MSQSVRVFSDPDALSSAFAGMLVRDIDRIAPDQYYSIALSGGSTPLYLFRYLSENFAEKIDWERLLIFWGDERCVPPESDESNYKMAYKNLLQNVPIPETNIFRIRGEEDPKTEAKLYSDLVRANISFFNEIPQFDLILLGLGNDGHTASVFPDSIRLFDSYSLFDVSVKPDSKQKRITATGRLINNALKVLFLVTGKEKAVTVAQIIEKKEGWEQLPAARVKPVLGQLIWMLDENAAGKLNKIPG
ncbi:MAG TPA: 6-phosphogluconolactonase [Bacteroidales bacterium]|nr:6-phosphogluconolactonase [Bacteroidales bacterium]